MSVAGAPSLRSCGSASSAPSSDRSCRKVTAGASSCWFDCGESDVKDLTNIASADYPKWVCSPCASARRALEKQGRENEKNKNTMLDLRKNQEKYKAMVRQSRITADPMISDRTQFQQRQLVLSNMFSCEAASRTAVQCLNDVLWLNKKQYIAHQVYINGNTRVEAVSMPMVTMIFLYTYYITCDFIMYGCNIFTHAYIVFI